MSSLIGGAAGGAAPSAAGAVARTTGFQRTTPGRGVRTPTMGGFGTSGFGGYGGYGGYGTMPYRSGGYYPQDAAATPLEQEIQAELEAGQYRPQQAAATPVTPTTPRPTTAPTTAASTFNQRFQQILSRAGQQAGQVQLLQDARIVPDERSNSLIVFANKQDMKMITNIVAKVDQLMAQVVIDAIIMDVQLSDSYSLGISWLMQPQQTGNWTQSAANNTGNLITSLTNIAGSSGFTYLAKYRDDLNVAVSALAGKNRGQILARPRIQTTHATPASFSVGETVPFISGTYQGGSIYGPSAYFSQLNVDTTLDVTPFITPDDLVVMEISQQISEISGFEEFPGVGKQPRTINRSATSTISVRDGETVILGGYIRASKSKTSSGVPLLKDIPLLGAAFRSKSSDAKRSELIVLIRPTILRTPEDAAREAQATRERLPGIRDLEEQAIEKEENTGQRLKTLFGK
jgi:type II secretion system protein D